MKKVYFLDFEDSYSYNLVAEIYYFSNILVEVIPLKSHHEFFTNLKNSKKVNDFRNATIILGPGPGKPMDYQFQFSSLKQLIKLHYPLKYLGICLGHQMLAQIQGMQIKLSKHPMHGQSEIIPLDVWWQGFFKTNIESLTVQRYNSLAVESSSTNFKNKLIINDHEIMLWWQANIFSMQFHPESVGTLQKEIIFEAIDRFIKN